MSGYSPWGCKELDTTGKLILSLSLLNTSRLSTKSIYFIFLDFFFYFVHFLKNVVIYFLATLGFCCCQWTFSSFTEWGPLFIAKHGLLIAVTSLFAEHGL